MGQRLELHAKLGEILGNKHVYFQPPETIKMVYPCIVYNLSDIHELHADDSSYKRKRMYTLTVIDKNPDSEIPDRLLDLPYCAFDRWYASDGLNHFVFTLYY